MILKEHPLCLYSAHTGPHMYQKAHLVGGFLLWREIGQLEIVSDDTSSRLGWALPVVRTLLC